MTSPGPHLSEGHHRYCRACGHDLLGLSGARCPECGRTIQWRPPGPADGASGRWLAAGVVGLGIVLAVVGLKYRRFEPRPGPGAAPGPVTRPMSPASSAATAAAPPA